MRGKMRRPSLWRMGKVSPSPLFDADLLRRYDTIIVDEAHRSIYGQWRGVLEY